MNPKSYCFLANENMLLAFLIQHNTSLCTISTLYVIDFSCILFFYPQTHARVVLLTIQNGELFVIKQISLFFVCLVFSNVKVFFPFKVNPGSFWRLSGLTLKAWEDRLEITHILDQELVIVFAVSNPPQTLLNLSLISEYVYQPTKDIHLMNMFTFLRKQRKMLR